MSKKEKVDKNGIIKIIRFNNFIVTCSRDSIKFW